MIVMVSAGELPPDGIVTVFVVAAPLKVAVRPTGTPKIRRMRELLGALKPPMLVAVTWAVLDPAGKNKKSGLMLRK